MIRSHTKGIYKGDSDEGLVEGIEAIENLARKVEVAVAGKESGFEKLYPTVVKSYFGGMKRHFQSVFSILKAGGNLSYQVFEFDRQPPKISPYTMLHYVLHFCRCKPSMDTRIHPRTLPEEIRRSYNAAVTRIFATECADVDELKIPHEESLKQGLAAFGIVELASDDTS